ncbi:MAG: TPM domain-containing protein [Eubacterium sp.]|nr:TPM domain-containing protein [Eubacterium sp.]
MKMTKENKLHRLFFAFLAAFLLGSAATVSAAGQIPKERQLNRLEDEADILTDSQEQILMQKLDEISERQQCDVAVVTVYSLMGKSAQDFADDFYDYNGYGMGTEDSGILLLISMEDRDWAISTYGFGIYAFTDVGIQFLTDAFLSELSDGDYMEAFTIYADKADDLLTRAANGNPLDADDIRQMQKQVWKSRVPGMIGAGVVLGILLAYIITRASMKKANGLIGGGACEAGIYMVPGSVKMTGAGEFRIGTRVNRIYSPRQEKQSGGSSTHVSSSGRSHGGASGKF